MKFWSIGFVMVAFSFGSWGQNALFQNQEPIALQLSFSIKGIKKITNDTIYTPSPLSYTNKNGDWDTLNIDLRARGAYRRANCFFPPLRIKLKKKSSDGELFSGNKNLKLVLPCETGERYNNLIQKEFLCYKLYEVITPYNFNTRLANVTLFDQDTRPPKKHVLKGFLIEDDDLVAKRFTGKVQDDRKLHPILLHDTSSVMHDFFQYMIANTDWSAMAQHNVKVIELEKNKLIPLAYDFDMAGLVNAPYAVVSEKLEISSVQERLYRGFCRSESLMQHVRSLYIDLEPRLMTIVNSFENDFTSKEFTGIKKYLAEFFDTLKSERAFKESILSACRTK